jgi:hypothetical protein
MRNAPRSTLAIRLLAGGLAAILVSASAWGGEPRINTVYPPTFERGVATSVQIVGKELATATELSVPFQAEISKTSGGNVEVVTFSIKPAPKTPPGVYPLRVVSQEGISNLRLIAVTTVPVVKRARELKEAYKNGRPDFEQAQRVEWPVVVTGGRLEREVDLYRFAVQAGQRLTLVTETRRLGLTPDPVMRLRDAGGRTLVYAHDTPGLASDERIDYTFDKAGEYILELESFGAGGWNNHYVARIGPFDYARALFPLGGRRGETVQFRVTGRDGEISTVEARVPAEPGIDQWRLPLEKYSGSLSWPLAIGDLPEIMEDENTTAEPSLLAWPVTVNGRISKAGEEDLYRIAVKPGEHIRGVVEAYRLGSTLDGYLMVYDPVGKKLLASNDDQTYRGNPDPGLTFQVPDDYKEKEVIICLRDTMNGGGENYTYRLTVERGGPDFYLWLGNAADGTKQNEENVSWSKMDGNDTLNLPVGQETKLKISVRRDPKQNDPHYKGPLQGYQGPIHLRAAQTPPGVTIKPAVIAEGALTGELICIASADAPAGPFEIVIVGEGTRPDGSVIRRIAERKLYTADAAMINLAWNWRVTKLACVVLRPEAASVRQATANAAK